MARLARSLRRATSPDSATLGGLKSEITKWRRRRAGDARSVDNMEYSTCSHDSERPIPPVYNKFRAKTLSFISLMIDPSRGESLRPTCEQSSETSGNSRGLLADAHGSATPRPAETTRPPQRRRRGPASRPAKMAISRRRDHAPAASLLSHGLDRGPRQLCHIQHHLLLGRGLCPGDGTVAACATCLPPQRIPVLHTSVIDFPKRVAVEGASALAKASTNASLISFSFINLLSSTFTSSSLSRSSLLTT